MGRSIRKLMIAGLLLGGVLLVEQPVGAQYSCQYEAGYCNGLGGQFTLDGECPWMPWPGFPYFRCDDAYGLIYDGCCFVG